MPQMSRYCKAFPIDVLKKFGDWTESLGPAVGHSSSTQDDINMDNYVFVHDTYKVTRGILSDQDVVYDEVSMAWIEFCKKDLQFSIPTS